MTINNSHLTGRSRNANIPLDALSKKGKTMSSKVFRHLMDWFLYHGLISLVIFAAAFTLFAITDTAGLTNISPLNASEFVTAVYIIVRILPHAFMLMLFPMSYKLEDRNLHFFKGERRDGHE
ncbi:MAG: hypothetical protein PHW53_04120 [Patescibacteria group bacterium]|nr:hypothetical protein [Patescibacteria group bacterium]